MSFLNEEVNIERDLGITNSKAMVEGELTLPSARDDMKSILSLSGKVIISQSEGIDSKINMGGEIRFNVLYLDEQGVGSFESSANFSHSTTVDGFTSGMKFEISSYIEKIEYSMADSRRVSVIALLSIDVRVLETQPIKPLNFDMTGIELKTDEITLPIQMSNKSHEFILREDVRLPQGMPPINSILKTDGYARIKNIITDNTKAIIEGELKVVTLYMSQGDVPVWQMLNTIGFEQILNFDMALDNLKFLESIEVKELSTKAVEDSDALMTIEAILTAKLCAYQNKKSPIIIDAYCPNKDIRIECQRIDVRNLQVDQNIKYSFRDTLSIPQGMPPVAKALSMFVTPIISNTYSGSQKATIEGEMQSTICYITRENNITSFSAKIPFSADLDADDVQPGFDIIPSLAIEQAMATGAGDDLEIRVVMDFKILGYRQKTMNIVSSLNDCGDIEDIRSALIIYIPSGNENLWNIAKKFYITKDSILKNNELEDANDLCGKKLLLFNAFSG